MSTNKRPAPWTPEENRAVVALYFRMLDGSLRTDGQLNKASLIRIARNKHTQADMSVTDIRDFTCRLKARSRGSVEAKLMNCSAAHRDLGGIETMATHGYKAWGNYQTHLKDCIKDELQNRQFDADVQTSQANEQRAGA